MFSLGLVLSLVSLSMAVEMPGISNTTQCVFVPGTRTFTCAFGTRRVECSAVTNFTTPDYHLFGIGSTPIKGMYTLYPRALDNTTYVTGDDFVLYFAPNFVHTGIRVINEACFGELIGLFDMITDFHTLTIGGKSINLVGEILINDATVQKRWLWGYGYGMGWPYYGWGGWGGYGMGYGMGYGGFGYGLGYGGFGGFWGR